MSIQTKMPNFRRDNLSLAANLIAAALVLVGGDLVWTLWR